MNIDTRYQFIAEYVISNQEKHYRLAFRYMRNEQDALEVVQEAIYKAFAHAHSLRDGVNLKSWFFRIIVNTALDTLAKNKRAIPVAEQSLHSLDHGKEDEYVDIDLKQAVDALEEPYHTIIVLRFFEDLSLAEVAAVLHENVNTIKSRLYKALKRLSITTIGQVD